MTTPPTMQAKTGQGAGWSRPRATYQDVLDAPPYEVAEVVDGELYTHPRPASPHALAGASLLIQLGGPLQIGRGAPGGWWIIYEPELHFGAVPNEDILAPDFAGWRSERMPEYPNAPYFTLAPDWICEILSPSTRSLDLGSKRDIYAREGVSYLWLVDPASRALEAFKLQDGRWELIAALSDDASGSLPPFETINLSLGRLWA